jgi:hypothetical protein
VVRYQFTSSSPIPKQSSAGPIIGSSFPPGDAAPRAVSREYFKKVCPNPTIIDSWELNEHLRLDNNVPALVIFKKWVEKLNDIDDPCVEIRQESFQLFEIWYVTLLSALNVLKLSIGCSVRNAYFQCGLSYPSRLS